MAKTKLTLQTITRLGIKPTFTAASVANGHSFDNTTEKVFIFVKNGHSASIVVTIDTPGTIDGHEIGNLGVTVPASEDKLIGPFPRALYDQADSDNNLNRAVCFTVDIDTAITLAAIEGGLLSY